MQWLYSRDPDKVYSKLSDVFAQNQNKAYYIYIWCIDLNKRKRHNTIIKRYNHQKSDKIFG